MRFVRVESLSFFILASSTMPTLWYPLPPSPSGGMADAEVSKTFVARRVSSSLTSGTIPRLIAGRSPKRWPVCFRFGHATPRSPPAEQEIELLPNTRLHMPTIAHLADCGLVALAQSDKHAIEASQTDQQRNYLPLNAKRPNGFTRPTSLFAWWPVRDSNPRHEDFQSSALPTELTGRKCRDNYTSVYRVASRTILKRFQVVFNLCAWLKGSGAQAHRLAHGKPWGAIAGALQHAHCLGVAEHATRRQPSA